MYTIFPRIVSFSNLKIVANSNCYCNISIVTKLADFFAPANYLRNIWYSKNLAVVSILFLTSLATLYLLLPIFQEKCTLCNTCMHVCMVQFNGYLCVCICWDRDTTWGIVYLCLVVLSRGVVFLFLFFFILVFSFVVILFLLLAPTLL